ncbi:MAG: polysaccharide deacetylase family protein [Oscillospiraceae bacterium]|nr:polysaccharide deacetylase family protein [Oscillospiraceae bacterium]
MRGLLQKYRRLLSLAGTALAAVLILWTVNSPAIVGASATERQLPVYCVQRDDKKLAISFDAAWGNEDTQTLIDILNLYGVRSTFFVVGDWAEKYPESVRALHDAGHEVMSHSAHHAHFSMMSAAEIAADLREANRRISACTGVEPTLFRCPYGEYDDHVIQTVRSLGMTAIQWSVDSLDWKGISADEICERVLGRVEPGSIVLFHNAAEHTPEALPRILSELQKQGYTIVPVSELLLEGNTRIDHAGRQLPAASA